MQQDHSWRSNPGLRAISCWPALLWSCERLCYSQQGWGALTSLRAFQTALLHLNPPPKPSCQMRSPRRMLPVCSSLARMYLHSSWAASRQVLYSS